MTPNIYYTIEIISEIIHKSHLRRLEAIITITIIALCGLGFVWIAIGYSEEIKQWLHKLRRALSIMVIINGEIKIKKIKFNTGGWSYWKHWRTCMKAFLKGIVLVVMHFLHAWFPCRYTEHGWLEEKLKISLKEKED